MISTSTETLKDSSNFLTFSKKKKKISLEKSYLKVSQVRESFLQNNPYLQTKEIIFPYKKKTLPFHYICSDFSASSQGTFLVLLDYGEKLENYESFFKKLNQEKISIVSFDWPGQGLQQNYKKKYKRSKYVNFKLDSQLLQFVLKNILFPDYKAPFYILGHGMGSFISLKTQPLLGNLISAFFHISPILNYYGYQHTDFFSLYCNLSNKLGFGWICHRHIAKKYKIFYNRTLDKKNLQPPTIYFMHQVFQNLSQIYSPKFIEKNKYANLFFYGDKDPFCKRQTLENYAQKLPLGSAIEIKNAHYDFLQESQNRSIIQQFWSALEIFLKS